MRFCSTVVALRENMDVDGKKDHLKEKSAIYDRMKMGFYFRFYCI